MGASINATYVLFTCRQVTQMHCPLHSQGCKQKHFEISWTRNHQYRQGLTADCLGVDLATSGANKQAPDFGLHQPDKHVLCRNKQRAGFARAAAFPRTAELSKGACEALQRAYAKEQRRRCRFAKSQDPGPPVVPFYPFLGGSPTKIDYRKKSTLILTSLLEDLEIQSSLECWHFCTVSLLWCVATRL